MSVLINKNFNGKIAIISDSAVNCFMENKQVCHETDMGWGYTPAQELYRELFAASEKVSLNDPILAPYQAHLFDTEKVGDPEGYIFI